MKRVLLCLAWLVAPCAHGAKLTKAVASYTITAELDGASHRLTAHETLRWRNRSTDTISELRFHLYLNAFRNASSTFLREAEDLTDTLRRSDGWGSIEIRSLRLEDSRDLASSITYIQPDDGNSDDRTLFKIALPSAVPPGGAIRVDLDFVARLPRAVRRTGYWNDFHFVGQWFPKIGVYEPSGERGRAIGGWNAHQFHALSEFYADFGDYDVTLKVPRRYVVGATGVRVAERDNGDGTVSYRYLQEDVHDFAWTADPAFVSRERAFLGERNIRVRLLGRRDQGYLEDRIFKAVFAGLAHYGLWYGPYPYDTLTVIVPPRGVNGPVGGMEYPTLITIESLILNPADSGNPEMLTIHELGHQWWYGLVASNEVEEPWLDEGLATYSTGRILDRRYGGRRSYRWLAGLPFPVPLFSMESGNPLLDTLTGALGSFAGYTAYRSSSATEYMRAYLAKAQTDPVDLGSWRYRDRTSYFVSNYWKVGLILESLEQEMGSDAFARALRGYYERWQFRHPATTDFVAALEAEGGPELRKQADVLLHGTDVLDYAVTSVENHPSVGPGTASRSEVQVARLGGLSLPTTVRATFEDGSHQDRPWDGASRWASFSFGGQSPLRSAEVDPERRLLLDVDTANNRLMTGTDSRAALKLAGRYLAWMEHVLLMFAAL